MNAFDVLQPGDVVMLRAYGGANIERVFVRRGDRNSLVVCKIDAWKRSGIIYEG